MVDAGRLGRKTGRGWYSYEDGRPHRPDDPPPPEISGPPTPDALVLITGWLPIADELRELAADAGWAVEEEPSGEVPWLIVDCGADPDADPAQGAPRVVLCAEGALHALDPGGSSAGFHALPPIGTVELTRTPATADVTAQRAEQFFTSLGRRTVWVGDAPGLVLGRIVCQVINECAFAVGEGVGGVTDVDDGLVLGMNHPRGPLAWADLIGLDHVVMVLDGLREEYGEERYRAAPLLRRTPAFHDD
jgi:3-hydroxybutyryl-CoA dehydrogenase